MTGSRRLSQAISEGDGISLIVPIAGDAQAARAPKSQGAEAVLVERDQAGCPRFELRPLLPILFHWEGSGPTSVSDALMRASSRRSRTTRSGSRTSTLRLADLGFELAFRIEDEEHLASALEHFDPEIFLLAPQDARDADDPLENVLDLLPDIPAGKLAIADLEVTTPDEIAELERAGVDAVIVGSQSIAGLVRAAPPEV